MRTIDWAKHDAKYAQLIDWSKKVGVMGDGLGGMVTYLSASNADQVQKLNIGAAVVLSPWFLPLKQSKVPIFFASS
jgi:hypothetical protein